MSSRTIQFRNTRTTKVQIELAGPTFSDYQRKLLIVIHFTETPFKGFAVCLQFDGYLLDYYPDYKQRRTESLISEVERLAKWFVLSDEYLKWPVQELPEYPRLVMAPDKKEIDNVDYLFTDQETGISINFPALSKLLVTERKLARKIILHELYNLSEAADLDDVVRDCHFPQQLILSEIDGLAGAGSVNKRVIKPTYLGVSATTVVELTMKGRNLLEDEPASANEHVFIIAACQPPQNGSVELANHELILQTIIDLIEDEQFEARFQEKEEPRKNIHADIFDHIDSCKFIVADVTHERPNCYIEIGWAMARQKQILLFVQKDYFTNVMKRRMPLDLSLIKYEEYSDSRDLGSKLTNRIRALSSHNRKQFSVI